MIVVLYMLFIFCYCDQLSHCSILVHRLSSIRSPGGWGRGLGKGDGGSTKEGVLEQREAISMLLYCIRYGATCSLCRNGSRPKVEGVQLVE